VCGTGLIGLLCGVALAASPAGASAATASPVTFGYTGAEQSYVVPSGVTSLQVAATGAPGATGLTGGAGAVGGAGADGARVSAVVPVTPGETLYLEVGGAGGAGNNSGTANGGFNGGGSGIAGGGGGGASDLRTVSCGAACPGSSASLQSRLLVAAGGAGGAGSFDVLSGGAGGAGGLVGVDGKGGQASLLCTGGGGGTGATASAGGAGGTAASTLIADPTLCFAGTSTAGVLGNGGAAAQGADSGGGGGGGYYGGGGGGAGATSGGGGGGGGSSFGPAGATFAQDATGTPAVTLTPIGAPAAQITPATLRFPSQPMSTVSAPQTVTITDTGQGPLNVTGLSFTGTDPGDFFVGASTCGGSVAVSASCQVTVFFVAQAQGARTGTLDVTSNDPLSPATVSLSGTGGPLPTGPAGPAGSAGPAGPSGPRGATGAQGPPGTVVCRRDAIAMSLCSIIFAPGTFTVAQNAKSARYMITLGRRDVASGRATIRRGVVTLVRLRALRRGRYQLVLTAGSGRRQRTLLKRTIRIA
jgi:hypothetical protein